MATKTPKNKTSKKLKSSSPENVETKQVSLLGGFLPGKEADLNEYLKDVPAPAAPEKKPAKKKEKAQAPAEVLSSSNALFAVLTERAMRMAHAQEDSQDELAASPKSLGLKKGAVLTTKDGTYDYQTGRHFTAGAISSDLSHFTEFHRLHNMVADALDKHSALQKISAEDDGRRTGVYDDVDAHLHRASRAITHAMTSHLSGQNLSKEVGTNLGKTVIPGSVTGFANAIEHLKNASKELETRTNGQFKGIDALADTLHAGYAYHVEEATSGLALASDSQKELEERARTKESVERLAETRPPQTVAPKAVETLGQQRARGKRIEAASFPNALQDPSARVTRNLMPLGGRMTDSQVAWLQEPERSPSSAPSDTTDTPLPGFEKEKPERTREEGSAALTARINEQDAASRAELQGKISNWREKNRARVRSVLDNPRFAERSATQREELSQRLATQETPFPQPEGRMAAFRSQQEGTSTTNAEQQRGSSLRAAAPAIQTSVAQYDQANRAIVQGHIDRGDLLEAATHHFKTVAGAPSAKQQEIRKQADGSFTSNIAYRIKTNPHRYLAQQGYAVGAPPRAPQEREVTPGRTPARIRVKAEPATGSSGEIVSRAKLNNPRKGEFSQGSSAATPFRPGAAEEYEAKLNEIQGR
jgi:hypothetical protein